MKKISLNTGWQFSKLPGSSIRQPDVGSASYQDICLPHTWYEDGDNYRGLGVYKKTISVLESKGKCLFLEIEGADHTVRAYVNEIELGIHKGGYSRVRFAIPESCMNHTKLELKLYVDNSITDDVSPLSGDFTVFGGLYRGVSLLITERIHFDYLYYGTDGVIIRTKVDAESHGILELEPHVVCGETCNDVFVRYIVKGPDGHVVASCIGDVETIQKLDIHPIQLWNGKSGAFLYTVKAELIVDGSCADCMELTTGFKKISLESEDGFILNGQHIRICGIAKHQDFGGRFSAVTDQEIERDFKLIDEIGANAVRLSHYQHPQYTYDCCDKGGYITWAEIPMLKMTENAALMANAKQQLSELILQNIHHPSICFWGVQNEIAMFRDAPFVHENIIELCKDAKRLDGERIVACANLYPLKAKSRLNHLTDMVGYNIYFGWYYGKMQEYGAYLDGLHRELPEVSLGISEYGVDAGIQLHAENPLVKDYSEEFQAQFHETVYPIIESRKYLWGSFVWNMFDFSSARRDEGGQKYINAKGLVTYDREIKKDAFFYYKAKWSEKPTLHICESRFVKRCRESVDIKVYTNLAEAVLARMEDYGLGLEKITEQNNGNGTIIFHDVALKDGKNMFCVSGLTEDGIQMEETICFEKVEMPEESYQLPDNEAGTAVQNWFLEEDIDTDQYFSLKDRAEDLLENEETHLILQKYFPDITALLEKGVIPMGLAMTSILSHGKDAVKIEDYSAINQELLKVMKK